MSNFTYSYDVDSYGVLRIYRGKFIIAQIEDCGNMPQEQISKLVSEIIGDW